MSQAPVTIRSLAKATGFSTATVSKALRNHPSVTGETRMKIQHAAEARGYRPNAMIRALMTQLREGRSPADSLTPLAMLNPWDTPLSKQSTFHAGLLRGCRERAASLGYRIDVFDLPATKPKRLDEILHARGIQGILIPPMASSHGHFSLNWDRYAVVALGGYSLRKPSAIRVMSDHYENMVLTIRQVRRHGHRRIGVLVYRPFDRRCNLTYSAAALRLTDARMGPDRVQVLDRIEPDAILDWVRRTRPDAVIAWHPSLLDILRKGGYAVPRDIGFALFTNAADFPGISGIDENTRHIGAVGVETLVARLHHNEFGIPGNAYTLRVPGHWLPGQTLNDLRRRAHL